ncbi:MAG TPA: DNA cytosine methyltransferase [Iamia sp.]|nr:DNA cytosine methyltransferase [Iamia sp.]
MTRPRLLDLFCGAGGAATGYHRAGFDVVGVDLVRQPHYPYEFHLANALTFPVDGFDAVHASPPCKRFSVARHQHRAQLFDPHPDLLTPTLARLADWGGVWIVENVPGAPMPSESVTYCGSSFGLRVRRHRLFASSVGLNAPACDHKTQGAPVGVYGNGGADSGRARRGGGGGVKVAGREAAEALGIDWTEHQPGLAQAIPPAYTEHIGRQVFPYTRS